MKTPSILALASYYKGQPFLARAADRGANVYLLTSEKLLHKEWPRDKLTNIFAMPEERSLRDVVLTVSYLARTHRFDKIVALDDFDVETAAHLREHLRLEGMGDSLARYFRDKLAMRVGARRANIPSPPFTGLFNDDEVRAFTASVPAPWMLKPRSQASATGIKKIGSEAELWETLHALHDERSFYLLEKYVAGDVYHVDSIISAGAVQLAAVHRCGRPPFDVAHGGGIFSSYTVERGSEAEKKLQIINRDVIQRFGLSQGTAHIEFIHSRESGEFTLLECASRVGGAHIADMVEAATGLNPWAEWADVELAGDAYQLPTPRQDYGGLVMCLARETHPDTSAFDDPEVVFRSPEESHVGLIVRSSSSDRARSLIESYETRLRRDVLAVMPAADKPAH